MKRSIISLAVVAALASAPVHVQAAELDSGSSWGTNIGVVAGGIVGAIVGGPPGAIAGMAIGGVTADQQRGARRVAALEYHAASLEQARISLHSERRSLKAEIGALNRSLDEAREIAAERADAVQLAHGLEFGIGFRSNSAAVPGKDEDGLEALALLLSAVPELEVRLDGYADPRGSAELNQALSEARAKAVRERLVQAGVDPARIHVQGHGAAAPDTATADPDSWALQRRVNIRLESREGRVASRP